MHRPLLSVVFPQLLPAPSPFYPAPANRTSRRLKSRPMLVYTGLQQTAGPPLAAPQNRGLPPVPPRDFVAEIHAASKRAPTSVPLLGHIPPPTPSPSDVSCTSSRPLPAFAQIPTRPCLDSVPPSMARGVRRESPPPSAPHPCRVPLRSLPRLIPRIAATSTSPTAVWPSLVTTSPSGLGSIMPGGSSLPSSQGGGAPAPSTMTECRTLAAQAVSSPLSSALAASRPSSFGALHSRVIPPSKDGKNRLQAPPERSSQALRTVRVGTSLGPFQSVSTMVFKGAPRLPPISVRRGSWQREGGKKRITAQRKPCRATQRRRSDDTVDRAFTTTW